MASFILADIADTSGESGGLAHFPNLNKCYFYLSPTVTMKLVNKEIDINWIEDVLRSDGNSKGTYSAGFKYHSKTKSIVIDGQEFKLKVDIQWHINPDEYSTIVAATLIRFKG